MASLSLKNVCKVYPNGFEAVKDFNLDVADKEFIIFVGPSGCGKSTTLRMIAGLEEISSGDLIIDGKVMNDVEPKDRDIAMVFQNYALYPHMTVFDNMAFGLKLRKVPKDEIKAKVEEAARILDLEKLLDRKPKALSGGQRQRVAMGRAIVRNPKVFLMDEPLSNLDAKLRVQMRSEIASLHNRLGATFIYVTHDQSEAMTLSDRIALMMEGEIIQLGTPDELYERPDNIRVAKFIGSPEINLVPALVRSGRLIFNGQATALRIASPDSTVTIGIRAQRVHTADVDADGPLIQLTVHREETLGEDVLLYGETAVDGRSYPFVARASAKQTYQLRKESSSWNKPILLEAASSGVLVFDEQGERIVSRLNGMQEAA